MGTFKITLKQIGISLKILNDCLEDEKYSIHSLITIILAVLVFISCTKLAYSSVDEIRLPNGFKIEEFASNLGSPRFMAFSPDDVLFVTIIGKGTVVALPDKDKNGKTDKVITFVKGLNHPHGIAFYKGYLYIGETNQIVRFKYQGFDSTPGKKEIIVPNLPARGHFTRTVGFGPDEKMYVSIGSSCNVCEEKDERRAAILQFNPDGGEERVFAKGLRNSVGITWNPETKELWATDNGRDWLGDNLPPEEINIVKFEKHYGWPYCYGDRVPDPDFDTPDFCKKTTPPVFEMQAHSAPLGLTFYMGKLFPEEYQGDLIVAFHGSWNRSMPTGYKVVRIKMKNGKPQKIEDFATGWLKGQRAWGRPVDLIVGPDGSLYVSDDKGGFIYRITVTK
ncbi:MAG TPA: sorbosone dehydrogenase family protein [Thermodesulfobacteriota bacterium]|nr:sorbosone dehydrogenase family protein [Thermodesulfobacteriota bacterium]